MRIQAERHDEKRRSRRLDVIAFATVVLGFWVGGPGLAQASGDAGAPGVADSATVDPMAAAFSDPTAFKPMSNAEMGEQRGGFDGIAFGIYLSGTLNAPQTTPLPPGVNVSTLDSGVVQIVAGAGNLAGANGIFQLTNVIGDMNIINNNIIINVTIQNQSPANTSTPGL